MGKSVTVKTGFSGVLLPNGSAGSSAGDSRDYKAGDVVVLTDAEYSGLNAAQLAAITLGSSPADPVRAQRQVSTSSKVAGYTDVSALNALGTVGTGILNLKVGWNTVTLSANVTAVNVAAQGTSGGVVTYGPLAGQVYRVGLIITQDGTGSRTLPLASYGTKFKFPGGTAPTLTTAAGSVDVLQFITTDGGATFLYLDVQLNVKNP